MLRMMMLMMMLMMMIMAIMMMMLMMLMMMMIIMMIMMMVMMMLMIMMMMMMNRPLVKTESFPGLDAASVRSSCSCDTDTTINSALIIKDTDRDEGTPRPVTTDSKKTKIEYLGSVPIDHKATDLNNLQHPMKNLYFKSIEMKNMGHQQLPGTMEVSETGLKVNYIR